MQCNANVRTPELWTTALIFAEPQKEWEVRRMENYQTEEDDQCKILIPSRSREMGEMIACAPPCQYLSVLITHIITLYLHLHLCNISIGVSVSICQGSELKPIFD